MLFHWKIVAGISREETKNACKEAYHEAFEELKREELTFSTCSNQRLRNYLARLHFGLDIGDKSLLVPPDIEVTPFDWREDEEKDTPRARDHLENELKIFGVKFGRGYYQLYDVHEQISILNLEDRKTGVLKGGTDCILGPYGLHVLGTVQQCCVAVELKTEEAMKNTGISNFTAQAALELIAANYFSNQMTVVLLTDLCSATSIFTLIRDEMGYISVVIYEDLTVSEGLKFVADHISEHCVPKRRHILEECDTQKDGDIILKSFKKARVSPLEDCVGWEHFQATRLSSGH